MAVLDGGSDDKRVSKNNVDARKGKSNPGERRACIPALAGCSRTTCPRFSRPRASDEPRKCGTHPFCSAAGGGTRGGGPCPGPRLLVTIIVFDDCAPGKKSIFTGLAQRLEGLAVVSGAFSTAQPVLYPFGPAIQVGARADQGCHPGLIKPCARAASVGSERCPL